ncbi:hypothetical protein GUITHDRAFT_154173 [Guillardia theta CCMP2712]|uniref:Transmembrane and coiled-coil domain-containing protein 4 n=1 Tax=Guillardia theta (strain CCMP2712) TaxID=905079 RepID=L1IX08_GUITC|nr:hypothetical protein GUITHDRAFT_154173 [Guillardia theta CCMP2712]EKX40385.1 hypothetical protein GUITHDRAFT_154173 [Guillardia theta CCMP2712]|eukprot:XP_005827365.1 hypothetical protein GUITHDRAFT_154173 [Guillardia theta CCMP2712]
MMRRTAELDEFAFDLIDTSPGLPVTIGVTGWLLDEDDSAWKVWDRALCSVASDGGETLALRWESKQLREMGRVVSSYLKSQAGYYTTSVVGSVVLGAAFFSLTWPRTLISAASWIDSTWSVTELRADKAGKELARTLASRVQGYRPVTLVGFGVGARMIFKCLLELSKLGAEGAGIVETAICMGTPCPANPKDWRRASSVCGHRLVNAYCQTDWVLSFLYRSSSFSRSVAGLQAIQLEGEENSNLENVDVTGIVKGHWDYRDKIHTLMQVFGLSSGFSVSVPASQEEEKVPETEPITVETSKEET